jgi:MFS family permease
MSEPNAGRNSEKSVSLGAALACAVAACMIYGTGAGIRTDIGILLKPLMASTSLPYEDVSFCIAVLQLVFGASQPFFGLMAAKRSSRFVLLLGCALLCSGFAGMAVSTGFITLFVSLSLLAGLGCGAIAFGLVFTSATYFAGARYAMMISGLLNAAAGMVGFALAPALQGLLNLGGLNAAMAVMTALALVCAPLSIVITSRDPKGPSVPAETPSFRKAAALAMRSRTFIFLLCGFSTCGFHMVIIESHLFSQYVSYGIKPQAASWAFSVYSIATIAGALLSGWLSTRLRFSGLLCFYYGFRAVWVALYIFVMPKNLLTAVIFATGLGLTGDATVSPTAGAVRSDFSMKYVAVILGFLFLGHQCGAFISAWAGGLLLKLTGGYTAIWCADIVLCTFASIASTRIPNRRAAAAE